MGQTTANLQIWTPDEADLDEPDVYLAAMAASIENGTGVRLSKLESFVGVNLSLASTFLVAGTTPLIAPYVVSQSYNFADGVTNNPDGSVQILTAGIYQVNFNASFLPANTTAAKINTYLYNSGAAIAYNSTYGESVLGRYSNCNISGVYKLDVNDVITARASVIDSNSNLQGGNGSCLSLALISRS